MTHPPSAPARLALSTPERAGAASVRRAFTLTEMLVVVVIIAVLISILLPAIGGARNSARRAATESFMSSIHQAVGQFRAAEQRMPGYFTVRDVGAEANYVRPGGTSGIRGFTYLENALLDLGGGVYEDQTASRDDPSNSPDLIKVGVSSQDPGKQVLVQRTAIGAKGGPGYLDIPEGFIDMGAQDSGRAGNNPGHEWMPHLIDSWGMPILMWPRDEFTGSAPKMALRDSDSGRARFYWAGNSAFTNAQNLGKGTKKSQWADSTLSENVQTSEPKLVATVAAVVGHPAFPDKATMADPEGPEPAEARGDVILQSAGPDSIYLEGVRGIKRYHYIPESFDEGDTQDWTWYSDKSNPSGFVEKSNDIISSGS